MLDKIYYRMYVGSRKQVLIKRICWHILCIFQYLRNLTLKTVLYPQFEPSSGSVFAVSSAPSPPMTRSCPIASACCRTWWSCCRWWGWGERWRGRQRWRRSSRGPCPCRWQGWRRRTPPARCKCVRNCTPCPINYDSAHSYDVTERPSSSRDSKLLD